MGFSSYILGCGGYVPKKILTNNDLSKKLNTTDEWIKTRTGINQRHIADKKQLNSDLICCIFTELSDVEYYDSLRWANITLMKNYYDKQTYNTYY